MESIDVGLAGTTRLMLVRAQDAAQRYLGKSGQAVLAQIEDDFPQTECMIGQHEGHFLYGDVPEFVFAVMPFTGDPALLVFGKGRFGGFLLLMPPSLRPIVDSLSPSARRAGEDASALVDHLIASHGATRRPGMVAGFSPI